MPPRLTDRNVASALSRDKTATTDDAAGNPFSRRRQWRRKPCKVRLVTLTSIQHWLEATLELPSGRVVPLGRHPPIPERG
jgi:hypothetical protein